MTLTTAGLEVPVPARTPQNLIQASDEPETRAAWMDHLADAEPRVRCTLGIVERSSGPHLHVRRPATTSNGRLVEVEESLDGGYKVDRIKG